MTKKSNEKRAAEAALTAKIGFVGVGRMGSNMVRRLVECGFNVTAIYDVVAATSKEVAQEIGAKSVTTLAEVTELSDVIFTVVTNDKAMNEVFFNSKDNLLTNAKGKLFINCATLLPETQIKVAKAAEELGAEAIEACMASSIKQAREGTLYLMVGGTELAVSRALPFLKKMSINLRHVGLVGSAAEVKALVNMVMNINTAGLAEGLGLGKALGHDLEMLREVFSQTGANSRVLETDGEDMQNREHDCWFSAEHAAKDSGIAVALGKEAGLHLPLAEATQKQYQRMTDAGLGQLDKSGIAELTFPDRWSAITETKDKKSSKEEKSKKEKSSPQSKGKEKSKK